MRTSAYKVASLLLLLVPLAGLTRDLSIFEKTCVDIGFKRATPAFGDCVLELDRRASATSAAKADPAPGVRADSKARLAPSPGAQEVAPVNETPVVRGDGSPDDATCSGYGFRPGTDGYAGCRMKLQTAQTENDRRQREFAAQQRLYEQQVAAAQAAEKRQAQQRKAQCNFRSAQAASQPGMSNLQALGKCEFHVLLL